MGDYDSDTESSDKWVSGYNNKFEHALGSLFEDFDLLPERIRTDKICEMIKNEKIHIYEIPIQYLNYEIKLFSVNYNGYALKDITYEERTEEMCLLAVKNFDYALRYVPRRLRNEEMCMNALFSKRKDCDGMLHKHIPRKFRYLIFNYEARKRWTDKNNS